MPTRPSHPLKPRSLQPGAQIAIVAPARPAAADLLPAARSYLQRRGYRVVQGEHVLDRHHYLAGTDADRAGDLMAAFEDPQTEAIFCARGGYGSGRLLSLLDYDLVAGNPKAIVGFSDITALQLALYHRTGLVSFSGALTDIDLSAPGRDPLVERSLWSALTNREPLGDLPALPVPTGAPALQVLRVGSAPAAGPLIPANLAVLCSLMGTPYLPDLAGAILLLEDVDEYPFRLDRMLNQLRLAGVLPRLAGLVLGQFEDCFTGAEAMPDLEALALEATTGLDLTVALGFPYGHQTSRLVVPLGVAAQIDADAGLLRITESALA